MHVLVIAAFALVLATPPHDPPWALVESIPTTLALITGQWMVLMSLVAIGTRMTLRRLDTVTGGEVDGLRFFARFQLVWRCLLLAVTVIALQFTPWIGIVRDDWGLSMVYGMADLFALTPFFLGAIGAWVIQYPVDRIIRERTVAAQLWEGQPARPVWSLKQYLGFHVRHNLLLIAAPMFGVLVLRDAEPDYRAHLTRWTGQPVSGQLAFLAGVGLIFLFSPFLLRYIWSTEVLPAGELRDRLERLCSRVGLRYRQILIWQTGGVMVNGAVMGLFAPLRYILLSDGLLESMEDDKIEAVFGHEAGHVKHHHIPYYLAFAVLSMLIAGGVLLLLLAWLDAADPVAEGLTGSASRMLLAVVPDRSSYLIQVSPILLVAVMWLVGFGWISRRFERQADLFGALTVTPEPDHCIRDCVVHHPQDGNTTQDPHALCGTAAELFAEALETIALLNGINPKSRSWRHSSIAYRAAFLRRLATEPARVRTFQGVVRNIKIVLFVGTAVALAVTVVLYLTGQLPPELVGVY